MSYFDGGQPYGSEAYVFYDQTEYAAAYNTYRPRENRPICTYCGKQGHTVQKCFRPNSQVQGNTQVQGTSSPTTFVPQNPSSYPQRTFIPPGNFNPPPRTVANVFTRNPSSASMPYYPSPAVNAINLDIGQMSQNPAPDTNATIKYTCSISRASSSS